MSTMTTGCIFPTELLHRILCYTSPQDVVRWRMVSKLFRNITYDFDVWRSLYANAALLRPPGPFPTNTFERAFVQSTRLARSWTIRGLQTMSRVRIPFKGSVTNDVHLAGGRWLLVCQSNRRFVLYDTDVDEDAQAREPHVIWEQKEEIVAWNKCTMTSEDGGWVIYVLVSTDEPPRLMLLEFRSDTESGASCETFTFDIPVSETDFEPELDGGQKLCSRSRFLSIPHQSLIFDTRTRTFYRFPEFRVVHDQTRAWLGSASLDSDEPLIVPTNAYVLVLQRFCEAIVGSLVPKTYTVVQAFTVRDDISPVENEMGVLYLSHEGALAGYRWVVAVVRDTVIDPTTGVTNVKVLERVSKHHGFKSLCVSLDLPKPIPDHVWGITTRQHLMHVRGPVPFDDDLDFCNTYYHTSGDGYARGFFTRDPNCTACASFGVMKFTIDATQDRCVAVLSGFSRAREWDAIVSPIKHIDSVSNDSMMFDGVRGRFYYIDRALGWGKVFIRDAAIVIVGMK